MIKFWEALEAVGAKNLKWGCKEEPEYKIISRPRETNYWSITEHYRGLSPAQSQYLGSCEAEATANLLEWWIWRTFRQHVTINAALIYLTARQIFYKDSEGDGGLLLGQATKAAHALGILPDGAGIGRVNLSVSSIVRALEYSPLVCGHRIWNGWFPRKLHQDNGCVDESQEGEWGQGHATLCVGTNEHNGTKLFVHMNSWGKFPPMEGMFAMTCDYSVRNMMSEPVFIKMPGDLSKWRSWEKLIICDP